MPLHRFSPAGISLVFATLVGCSAFESEECTSDVWPSVRISVVDANGAVVGDAKVTFTLNGGPSRVAGCYESADGGCLRFQAGAEEVGTFSLSATSADGSKSARSDVVVGGGGCGGHVKTVDATLTLR